MRSGMPRCPGAHPVRLSALLAVQTAPAGSLHTPRDITSAASTRRAGMNGINHEPQIDHTLNPRLDHANGAPGNV